MSQLNLILENIRLSHIEKLLQEAQTEQELQSGISLINESMQMIAGSLMEEAIHSNHPALNKQVYNQGLQNGFTPKQVMDNRRELAYGLRTVRRERDHYNNKAIEHFNNNDREGYDFSKRQVNTMNNASRLLSRIGGTKAEAYKSLYHLDVNAPDFHKRASTAIKYYPKEAQGFYKEAIDKMAANPRDGDNISMQMEKRMPYIFAQRI